MEKSKPNAHAPKIDEALDLLESEGGVVSANELTGLMPAIPPDGGDQGFLVQMGAIRTPTNADKSQREQ